VDQAAHLVRDLAVQPSRFDTVDRHGLIGARIALPGRVELAKLVETAQLVKWYYQSNRLSRGMRIRCFLCGVPFPV
jgi:hypothetical protein